MKIYVYNDKLNKTQDAIFYILSYVKTYSETKFETILFTLDELEIENSSENYIFFSYLNHNNFLLLLDLVKCLREKFREVKINIVMGGISIRYIDVHQLMQEFPEVKYVLMDYGEELSKMLIEGKLKPGIYDENDSHKINKYRLDKEYYNYLDCHLLVFNGGSNCSNECKFCQKNKRFLREKNTTEDVFKEVRDLYNLGHKKFFIYDNYLDNEKFINLLKMCLDHNIYDVKFSSIGGHVSEDFKSLYSGVIKEWQDRTGTSFPLKNIGIGVEFYSQEVLDLYNKGTTLYQINKTINDLNELGLYYSVYIMHSLPGVSQKSFLEHKRWVEDHSPELKSVGLNYFKISYYSRMWNELDKFKIKLLDKYTVSDYFKPTVIKPIIDTHHYNFLAWDDEYGRYITREESYQKYKEIKYKCKCNDALRDGFLLSGYKWKRLGR